MCKKLVEENPWLLEYVPNHFMTQKMCDDVVHRKPWLLEYIPDWFVREQQIGPRDDDDVIIKWYNVYQKRRAQKAKIKEELLSIAWHPDRVMDWCMTEDEKERWK